MRVVDPSRSASPAEKRCAAEPPVRVVRLRAAQPGRLTARRACDAPLGRAVSPRPAQSNRATVHPSRLLAQPIRTIRSFVADKQGLVMGEEPRTPAHTLTTDPGPSTALDSSHYMYVCIRRRHDWDLW